MKTIALTMTMMILAQTSFAKTLSISCEGEDDTTVSLALELENANKPGTLTTLNVNSEEVTKHQPATYAYDNGVFQVSYNFGRQLYSSIELSVQGCENNFTSSGTGTVKLSTGGGGFAGPKPISLTCSCELK
jgi:hypothetical protein